MSQLGREPELWGEQHTGTEGLEDDRSPKSAPATPERGSPVTGRFVDARSPWFVSLPDPGPRKEQPPRGVGTAPTPLFSAPTRSSAILVEPRINPVETGASLAGGTPIRIRAGKHHSDSAHEAGTSGRE
jgi:hypothetical protein